MSREGNVSVQQAPGICLKDVSKVFQQGRQTVRAIDRVSFEVEPGEFVAITGASGSGKSTLLHLIAALETPTEGTITIAANGKSNADSVQTANAPV